MSGDTHECNDTHICADRHAHRASHTCWKTLLTLPALALASLLAYLVSTAVLYCTQVTPRHTHTRTHTRICTSGPQ
jgi:hypothetical protein